MLAQTFIRVRPDVSRLGAETNAAVEKPMREAGQGAARSFSGGFSSVRTGAVAGLVASITTSLSGLAVKALRAGLSTAAGLEQAQIGFTTLLKSGAQAQAFLGQLKDFAARTPFNLPGLVDDARLLLGVGFAAKQVIPTLTAWGDAAGALGIQQEAFHRAMIAVSQSMAAGKINAQDMNQIVEAGIPVWKLMSEATGKPIPVLRKLSEQGKLLSGDILPKLAAQMERDYGGAMAKQSQTLNGLWSTFTDTVNLGLGDALAKLTPSLTKILPRATAGASAAIAGLSARLSVLVGDVAGTYGWLHEHLGPELGQAVHWFTGTSTAAGELRATMAGAGIGIGVATTALKVLTVAMWAFNLATRANPVGLIITALVALVAGVLYAWKHFAGFRNFVLTAWADIRGAALSLWHNGIEPAFHGIAAVAMWLWNNVLYPTFAGWRIIIMDGIVPAALWLWHNAIEPAFHGIAAAVRVAWLFIGPVLNLFGFIIEHVVAPVVLWLWHNVIEKAFQAISIIIQIAWNIIEAAFRGWENIFRAVIGPAVMWFWHAAIEPAFKSIGDVISFVWVHVLKPTFEGFAFIIEHVVAPAFSRAVDFIKVAWARIQEAAKTPINFVIGFVNAGIISPFNAIAGFFGVKDRIGTIAKLATGGLFRGAGGPRDDKNLVMLSDTEFVVNAAATAKWLPVLEWINSQGRHGHGPKTKYPGDGSYGIAAFADGGLVGWLSSIGSGILDFITNPGKVVGTVAGRLLSNIPGGAALQNIIAGMGHRLIDGLVHWVTNLGGAGGANVGGALAFLRAQNGKPYVWAAAGPNGYDCSGLVSAVWNVLHGRNPYSHTFSTANEAGFFPLPGFGGALTAGWAGAGERGGGRVGHTAGVLLVPGLGPVPFESTGSAGVHIGASVTPLSAFAHIGHFDAGGRWPTGTLGANTSGRAEYVSSADAMERVVALLERIERAIFGVAPGVGAHISGVGSSIRRIARAT
jgi:tape measure domain-containing protein